MQLPFVVVFTSKDKENDLVIWADDVKVRPEGLFFIEFLEEGMMVEKAAFKNWLYYYVSENLRKEYEEADEI